jgi:hypothetical protein
MKRSENRILTTQAGSPGHRDSGVRRQADVGMDIVNDGEFGKSSWANYILERISGFENRPNQKAPVHWLGRDPTALRSVCCQGDACTGPIAYTGPIPIDANIRLDPASVREAFLATAATRKPLPLQACTNNTRQSGATFLLWRMPSVRNIRECAMPCCQTGSTFWCNIAPNGIANGPS